MNMKGVWHVNKKFNIIGLKRHPLFIKVWGPKLNLSVLNNNKF